MNSCPGCDIDSMWPPRLIITYVDGEILEGNADDWSNWRGHGVARIDIARRQHAGQSFYWLYQEEIKKGEMAWVCGSFAIHSKEARESIHRQGGEELLRNRRDVPDLYLNQVKLGWWWK